MRLLKSKNSKPAEHIKRKTWTHTDPHLITVSHFIYHINVDVIDETRLEGVIQIFELLRSSNCITYKLKENSVSCSRFPPVNTRHQELSLQIVWLFHFTKKDNNFRRLIIEIDRQSYR